MTTTTARPIADVYWFDEFAAWAITLYADDKGNRALDEDECEIEADWFALKGQAVEAVKDMLHRGEIARYEVYTKAGALQQSVVRKKGACTS